MKKKESNKTPFKIVSLQKLAQKSGIPYMTIYNTVTSVYNGLTDNQKTQLASILCEELVEVFEYLGFEIKLKRIYNKKEEA